MRVVGDLLTDERRTERVALRQPGRTPAAIEYDRLCTNTWKTAHLLRHRGARTGAAVGIIDDPAAGAVMAFLASALVGASVRVLGPSTALTGMDDTVTMLVGPTDRLPNRERVPSISLVGYGAPPSDPAVSHLERDSWSENPTPPPERVDPDTPLLYTKGRPLTHTDVLGSAGGVIDRYSLGPDDVVAIRAPLSNPGTVIAGILAPLRATGTVCFPDDQWTADIAISTSTAPEDRVIDPRTVV